MLGYEYGRREGGLSGLSTSKSVAFKAELEAGEKAPKHPPINIRKAFWPRVFNCIVSLWTRILDYIFA